MVLKNKANDILIGSLVYTAYPQSKLGRVEGCSGNSVIVRLCDRTSSPTAEVGIEGEGRGYPVCWPYWTNGVPSILKKRTDGLILI